MAVFNVEDLTVIVIVIIAFEFVKLTFKEDKVVFLCGSDTIFLQKVHSQHISKILELFYHFLIWQDKFLNIEVTLEHGPT